MSKFSLLTFYKRFDKDAKFVAVKDFIFNGEEIKADDEIDKSKMPWNKLKSLWQVRKIAMISDDSITEQVSETSKTKEAKIQKTGVWFKVYDENGNQIGKPTRDETEAELIKIDYEN
jgi:hypothetical protein